MHSRFLGHHFAVHSLQMLTIKYTVQMIRNEMIYVKHGMICVKDGMMCKTWNDMCKTWSDMCKHGIIRKRRTIKKQCSIVV